MLNAVEAYIIHRRLMGEGSKKFTKIFGVHANDAGQISKGDVGIIVGFNILQHCFQLVNPVVVSISVRGGFYIASVV